MYPRVRIHMDRLRRNLDACAGIIQKVPGCTLMIVTKGVCAYPPIVRMLTEHPGVDFLADSRIQNLKSYAAQARQASSRSCPPSGCWTKPPGGRASAIMWC